LFPYTTLFRSLDIALALPLQASTRWHPIEVAIDVNLEQRRWMIARPPRDQRLNPCEAKRAEIKPVHESVDRANRIVFGHIIVQQGREKCALAAIAALHKPC